MVSIGCEGRGGGPLNRAQTGDRIHHPIGQVIDINQVNP